MATSKVAEKLAIHGGTPVRTKPFGPRWFFDEEDRRQVLEVIDKAASGGWGAANKVQEFEDEFARLHDVKYAFATDSATGAIHAAIGAVNPEPGDEIITSPVTNVGTVLGVVLQNAIPVFADWDADTFSTDPADIERRITDRTRAIIAVHYTGNPCDMDAIMDIARRHDLIVIEDCATAHFAEYKGKLVGTIGDMGCFSMGGKLITAGGGGMFISNNEKLARRAKGFANKGAEYDQIRNSLQPTSEFHESYNGDSFLGDFHRMSPLMAAAGLAQLGRLEKTMRARGRVAEIIDEMVADLPGFQRPKIGPGDKTSYCYYYYRIVEELMGVSYGDFHRALDAEGIPALWREDYRPLHKAPMFVEERTYGESRYPFVDEQGNRRIDYASMHLPVIDRELRRIGCFMVRSTDTEEDARDIGTAFRKIALHYAARK